MQPTRGMRSSELWLSLATIAAATVLAWRGAIPAEMWATVVAGVSGAYSIGRGLAKRDPPEASPRRANPSPR